MKVISKLIREPVVHFLAIGAALFLVFAIVSGPQAETVQDRMDVTTEDVVQLVAQFRQTWRRPPTSEELDGLIRAFVREEILVQEALALSMDADDPVIRRRLAQKMEFLIESAASALVPAEADLRSYYSDNIADYTAQGRLAFEHVFLGQSVSPGDVADVLAALQAGTDPAELGQRTLLPARLDLSGVQAVDGIFGAGVFSSLSQLEPGVWSAPVLSGYGVHAVRVLDKEAAAPLPFEAVRAQVESDWRAAETEDMVEGVFSEIEARYVINTPTSEELEDILN